MLNFMQKTSLFSSMIFSPPQFCTSFWGIKIFNRQGQICFYCIPTFLS
ncbi:hypothetical protein AAJ76_1060002391 [Vairimorpha ceranae]|uniref:Uncharacterized protein n=1 Tax=Vairimorpha ceranae TaxID=40302 RepID=A0A0F9W8Z6_9MICR|nr:hypothetical protein AAJ76_1060002391 [Vairimorpha ceranae]KKO74171.1 hypothetical protein AAJ76_1060002391 [Vairimorpha ceranae]